MSGLEFEKNMQQKLDELNLRPSDAVWNAVAKEIRKDKRRRVLLWWWPLLCLSLAAGGYFTWHELSPKKPSMARVNVEDAKKTGPASTSGNPTSAANAPDQKGAIADRSTQPTPQKNTPSKAESSLPNEKNAGQPEQALIPASIKKEDQFSKIQKEQQEERKNNANVQPQVQSPENADVRRKAPHSRISMQGQLPGDNKGLTNSRPAKETLPADKMNSTNAKVNSHPLANREKLTDSLSTAQIASPTNKKRSTDPNVIANNELIDSGVAAQVKAPTNKSELTDSTIIADVTPVANSNKPADSGATAQVTASTNKADSNVTAQATPANKNKLIDSAAIAQTTTPAPKKISSKKLHWQWGAVAFAGGGQTASSNGINLKSAAPVDVTRNYYAQAAPAAIGPGINSKPSEVKAELAYTAGIFGRLITSKRVAFTAALQYARYTTSITVGQKTYSVLYNSLNNARVNGYYRGSNADQRNYKNVYQFIELPFGMEWQVNRSKSFPLYLNAGPSIAYLFKTDALHYDSKNGVYYSDNDLFSRWQFDLSTGLEVGLFNRGRIPLRVGPSFSYGVTSLVHGVPEKQHILSLGLKLKVLLKK